LSLRYLTVALLVALGIALPAVAARSTPRSVAPPTATKLELGKRLYRKYCGQCHALTVALAAGFGSNNGLGTDGGPSFDNLRVPFNLSVLAVTQPFIGHERLVHRMKWTEIKEVATFVETVTRRHTILAQNTDG